MRRKYRRGTKARLGYSVGPGVVDSFPGSFPWRGRKDPVNEDVDLVASPIGNVWSRLCLNRTLTPTLIRDRLILGESSWGHRG